jgi:hypothetical protein
MDGACSTYGGEDHCMQVSVGKASGKITLERMHVAFVFCVDLSTNSDYFPIQH